MQKIILILAVLVLFAAACGDDSTLLADQQGDGDGASADDGSDDDGSADEGSDDMADGSDSEFCQFNTTINDGLDDLDLSLDPADIEASFEHITDSIDRAVGMAPDEIRDDVAVLADGVKGFVEVFAEYDFNSFAMPESAADDPRFSAVDDPAYEAAAARVNAYCGFDDEPDTSGLDSDDPGLGSGADADLGVPDDQMRDIVIQSLKAAYGWDDALAECVVDELGLEDPANADPSLYTDPTVEVCGQPLVELFGG